MARYVIKRIFTSLLRLVIILILLLGVMELAYVLLGTKERHVWEIFTQPEEPTSQLLGAKSGARQLLVHAGLKSLTVVAIAFGVVVLVGYGWGILGGRLRKVGLVHVLSLPFSIIACIPGFWLVTMVSLFTVLLWNRPGFAGEVSIVDGPNFLNLWHAVVLAVPVSAGCLVWQLRAVTGEIQAKAREPYLRSLFIRGHSREVIFYRNIFAHALSPLCRLFEKTLSPMIGALITVEWAYRYPGAGNLLVESCRTGWYEGIFAIGAGISLVIVATAFCREIVEKILVRHNG